MRPKSVFVQNQKIAFNKIVRDAETRNIIGLNDYASRNEFETLFKLIPDISKSSILDIGCGVGRFTIPLAKNAKRVTGIDMSEDSIRILRAQVKKHKIRNISTKAMDILKYSNAKRFDCVLLVNVIHHFPNVRTLLTKIKSLLRPNGILLIYEFNPLNPLFIPAFLLHGQMRIHMNKEYLQSIRWVLEKYLRLSGFKIMNFHRHAFLPSSLYNVNRGFMKINSALNLVPIIQELCAFHMMVCTYEKR